MAWIAIENWQRHVRTFWLVRSELLRFYDSVRVPSGGRSIVADSAYFSVVPGHFECICGSFSLSWLGPSQVSTLCRTMESMELQKCPQLAAKKATVGPTGTATSQGKIISFEEYRIDWLSDSIPGFIGSTDIQSRTEPTGGWKQEERTHTERTRTEADEQQCIYKARNTHTHRHRTSTTSFYIYNTLPYSLYFPTILPHSCRVHQATR